MGGFLSRDLQQLPGGFLTPLGFLNRGARRTSGRAMGTCASARKTEGAGFEAADKNKDGKLTEDELRPSFGNRGGSGAGRQNRDGQEGRPSFQGGNRPSTRGEGGQSNRRRSRSNGEGQERRPR